MDFKQRRSRSKMLKEIIYIATSRTRPVVRKVIDHDLYSEQWMAIFFKNRLVTAKKLDNSSESDFVTKRRQINLFLPEFACYLLQYIVYTL